MAKLCIARPTGFSMECPDIGTWLFNFGFQLRRYTEITEAITTDQLISDAQTFQVANPRIGMMRNMAVENCRKHGITHMLFIDPDMAIDRYVRLGPQGPTNRFLPFFHTAWPFMSAHGKNHGPAIMAAPYCGRQPDEPVHVFVPNQENRVVRLSREKAQSLEGWHSVAAVGTGCMLIDMRVFDHVDPPYFSDLFKTIYHDDLNRSQDVNFCLKCAAAKIPIYVNFSCPAGHWQYSIVEWPGTQAAPPVEQDTFTSPDPRVPQLREQGAGDRSWS